MPPPITCRRVAVEEILPLRHRILRAGLPFETACFDGDHDANARHYAAFSGDEPACCLSLMRAEWEGRPAWQLRGMATAQDLQGSGLGRRLLEMAVAEARQDDSGRVFWCNARTSAIGFYEKLGWRVMSEPFEVPTAGPHVKMALENELPKPVAGVETAARPPVAAFIAAELAFLAAAHFLGGPPWVALGVLALAGQVAADFRLGPLLGLVPAAGWMVAHHLTGNRELFFPYAMALAVHLACQFVGRGRVAAAVAGGLLLAAPRRPSRCCQQRRSGLGELSRSRPSPPVSRMLAWCCESRSAPSASVRTDRVTRGGFSGCDFHGAEGGWHGIRMATYGEASGSGQADLRLAELRLFARGFAARQG